MKTIFFTTITWIWVLASCSSKTEVSSPDGHIKWAFQLDEKGEMTYHVTVKGQPFILSSSLGFEEKSGLNLKSGFQLINTKFDSEDEIWTQPWGENKTIRSHYNEMAVNLRNGDGAKLDYQGEGIYYYDFTYCENMNAWGNSDGEVQFKFRPVAGNWDVSYGPIEGDGNLIIGGEEIEFGIAYGSGTNLIISNLEPNDSYRIIVRCTSDSHYYVSVIKIN